MITNLVEGTKTKCHQYWPDKDSVKFGPFEVSVIDQQILTDYTVRSLVLQVHTYHRQVYLALHKHYSIIVAFYIIMQCNNWHTCM